MATLRHVLDFVKIEHSLFALPFIFAGWILGLREAGIPLAPSRDVVVSLGLVLAAGVSARTAAMTVNRILDRAIDARNPRTANRHLVTGALSLRFAWALAIVSFAALGAAAWALNPLCLALSPVLVGLFVLYPYMKRFSWACHFVLGLAFLAAAVGGYLAVTGSLAGIAGSPPEFWGAVLVGLAAFAWVAGFDVIYALLDVDVDRAQGIHSIPARFGIDGARRVAVGLHVATVVLLAGAGAWLALGVAWWGAVAAVGSLLVYEHATVDPRDPAAINKAFFTVNAVVGWVALVGLAAA